MSFVLYIWQRIVMFIAIAVMMPADLLYNWYKNGFEDTRQLLGDVFNARTLRKRQAEMRKHY